jgi:hypothetical protein
MPYLNTSLFALYNPDKPWFYTKACARKPSGSLRLCNNNDDDGSSSSSSSQDACEDKDSDGLLFFRCGSQRAHFRG